MLDADNQKAPGSTGPFLNSEPSLQRRFLRPPDAGVLHRVREPDKVVSEMVRLAGRAVFLSEHNIVGLRKAIFAPPTMDII